MAARAAGTGESTLYEWMERKPEFTEAVKSAEAEREKRLLIIINDAAPRSWQAAAWILERTAGQRYAKPETQIKGMTGVAKIEEADEQFTKMSDEELSEVIMSRSIEMISFLRDLAPDKLERFHCELERVMQ